MLCALPGQGLLVGSHDKKVRVWLELSHDAAPSRVLTPPHYDQISALTTAVRAPGNPDGWTALGTR